MRDGSHSRYSVWLLAIAVAWLVLLAGTVALVDPYAMFDGARWAGFNAEKTEAHMMSVRSEKSVRLALGGYDAVVLGSSRAAMGIDPRDPAFAGRTVYNASLFATSLEELARVQEFVAERRRPELWVVGLDLLLFSGQRVPGREFEISAFSGRAPWRVAARRLLSWDAFTTSLRTVASNRAGDTAAYRPDGSVRWPPEAGSGVWNHRERFHESLRHFALNVETYACFRYDAGAVERLLGMVDAMAAGGTPVWLFLSPAHAEQLELIHALGLWDDFERWKRELVAGLARREGPPVALWDFTGYSAYTSEAVPGEGGAMRWFWESSHYKSDLGRELLARIRSGEDAEDGFGVRLEPAGLEAHLAGQRAGRRAWVASHGVEQRAVARLVHRTEPTRRQLCGLKRTRLAGS